MDIKQACESGAAIGRAIARDAIARDVLNGEVVKRGYTAAYEPEIIIACGSEQFGVRYDCRGHACKVWPKQPTGGPLTDAEIAVLVRIAKFAGVER